jgi:hypothetical protein
MTRAATWTTAVIALAATAAARPSLSALAVARPAGGQVSVRADGAPGISPGTSRSLRLTATNWGRTGATITRVRLAGVTPDARHRACVTADLTMADVALRATVAPDAREHVLPRSGRLRYAMTAVDQGACRGARLRLAVTASWHVRGPGS